MAKFKKNKYGVGYIVTTPGELYKRTKTNDLACDRCRKFALTKIIVVPCENEKFCKKCGTYEIEHVKYDEENMDIMQMREDDWKAIFAIEKAPELAL